MKLADARRYALSLPETTEAPHHHMTSFRVRGKIFATAPPEATHLHVFVGEEDRAPLIASEPGTYEALWWGQSNGCARGPRQRRCDDPQGTAADSMAR